MINSLIEIAKLAANVVASAGVTTVVGNVVKATTPENIGKVNKALTVIGGLMVSTVIANEATRYIGNEIDKIVEPILAANVQVEEPIEEAS